MKDKKIPWWEPEIGREEYTLVKGVLDKHFPNQGDLSSLFETKVANLLHAKHAIVTTSGSVALFLALKALSVGLGDEVLVPDVTFIATANAVTMCGATPVLVDVDPKTMNIDINDVERKITPKTKAIIPVHISGRGTDILAILDIAKKNDLKVVEDAAEAFFSKKDNAYLGTHGDLGCFSLSPNKTITSGQGGIVVTNDDEIAVRVRQLKNQGVEQRLTGGDDIHPTIGFNFKFTDIQAAVALGQFNLLEDRIFIMKRNHLLYKKYLSDLEHIEVLDFDVDGGEVPQWTDVIVENRDELVSFLNQKNIFPRKFWLPIHTQEPYKQDDEGFKNSLKCSANALWLPSAFTLSEDDILYVCESIKSFYSNS